MNKKTTYLLCVVLLLSVWPCFSQTTPQWRVIESVDFESEDICVAAFTEDDHSQIDKTGTNNSREGIQELLNKLGSIGGGTLYLSAGKYKIDGQLFIPKGVVLRGDWKKPLKDTPVIGTILMAYSGRGSEDEANSFITMEPTTGLYNLTIWYPEQLPDNITPYSPTILYGRRGYWGNDYCNVRNVNLINSYSGVVVSRNNGGGCPNIFNLYGSPLSRGIEIDNIADVGRFDWIDFSPDYWSASGLPNAPTKDGVHKKYIHDNATGIVMRRNDWSYTCHFSAEGYHTGFYAAVSKVTNDNSLPNGHNYHFIFNNCNEAIRLDGVASVGIMFTHIRITDCDHGIVVGKGVGSTAQFYDCEISSRQNAIKIDGEASLKLMTQQCKIHSGKVNILGGIFVSVDGDFNNEQPQISTGIKARMILSGNRFAKPAEIDDRSLFVSSIDHKPVSIKPLPDFPEVKPRETKPAKNTLYIVTDSEFGAVANTNYSTSVAGFVGNAVLDCTNAIQKALDKAGNDGGGIVFLPPGKYMLNGNLVIPEGVELKGASDVASVPKGPGSIIEVYAGKNNPDGTPFLKLSARSGIRGITFNYPEQKSSLTINPSTMPKYPYCLQATGSDVYIVNIGIRATYNGIDLFTYKCDNHYIDYFAGHIFKNAIRIGGGSSNGIISNVQFNSLVMSAGHESKFGSWPNSENNEAAKNAVYDQNWKELEFMILEDCQDQILYNNFHYASHQGIIFGKNSTHPSGISMGLGLDASLRSICFEGLDSNKGFDLINTQVVSIAKDNIYSDTRYIETSPAFKGEAYLYSSDYWGNSRYAGVFGSGKVNFLMPHFEQYGSTRFLDITGDANIYISTCDVNTSNFVTAGKAGQVAVESSVVVLTSPSGYRSWWNNLTTSPIFRAEATLPRTGWIAYSNYNNFNTFNAIDGNAATRWDTGSSQTPGQWFYVDTQQPVTFNTVILDCSMSPNDWPSSYAVHVSENGINWGAPILTGSQPSSVVIISLPETTSRYVRISQTGSGKTQYWSIHEFYLANVNYDDPSTSINKMNIKESSYPYIDNRVLYFSGIEQIPANALIRIFNSAGQNVLTSSFLEKGISLEHLSEGIYIVIINKGNRIMSWKIII